MSNVLRAPKTAWPTVVLAAGCVLVTFTAIAGTIAGVVSSLLGGLMVFVAAFAAFTPMHDASHRSVSRHRWLNEAVGRACSAVLLSPYVAFRYVHLEHHKHTNHPEHDPDFYSGAGPAPLLPLRWLTQDLHYYVVIIRRWTQRPLAERIELVITVAVIAGALSALVATGHGLTLLLVWLIPVRLAIAALALSFDYLPHVPHQTLASEDRFEATRIIIAPGLTALFLFQNYHLIHHLFPGIPFYRYRRVYDAKRDWLRERGAVVRELRAPARSRSATSAPASVAR